MATAKQRNTHPRHEHEMRAVTEQELRYLRKQVRYRLNLRKSPVPAKGLSPQQTKELRAIAKTFVEQDY